MTIATILQGKGDSVISVKPDDTLAAVATTLTHHRIGAALVRGPDGAILGILSERDIVRMVSQQGAAAVGRPAREAMTALVHTVTPETHLLDALGLMTDRRVRHLPVMQNGHLAGMISIGDLVKARLVELESEAENLRAFVTAA